MDAEDAEFGTAVGFAGEASWAGAAFDVGQRYYGLAGFESATIDGDLGGQFVAEDARVFEVGLTIAEGVVVGAADPDFADAQ
jgi:hypothetical protein